MQAAQPGSQRHRASAAQQYALEEHMLAIVIHLISKLVDCTVKLAAKHDKYVYLKYRYT